MNKIWDFVRRKVLKKAAWRVPARGRSRFGATPYVTTPFWGSDPREEEVSVCRCRRSESGGGKQADGQMMSQSREWW